MARQLFPMLQCVDLARSLELYADLLGGVATYRFPEQGDAVFVVLRVGETSEIGLGVWTTEPVHGRPQRPATGHRIELCAYVDDVDETVEQARTRGFEIVAEPTDMPWGERTAWLADPDGNLVMLAR